MLTYFLYALFLLSCFVLVVTVLLQPGKSDPGALFSNTISSTAFGPRGTQTLLAKITIVAAAVFMLTALTLALPGISGTRSVLQSQGEETQPTPQSSPATSPAQGTTTGSEQNANTAVNTNAAPPAQTTQGQASPEQKK